MRKSTCTESQIVGILKEADAGAYSPRSASTGIVFAGRRAGSHTAMNAVRLTIPTASATCQGSSADTSLA